MILIHIYPISDVNDNNHNHPLLISFYLLIIYMNFKYHYLQLKLHYLHQYVLHHIIK